MNIILIDLSINVSGGELLEMRLLDSHLLDTFGSKSIARHKFYQLLESS
jgi:Leu/Phe-tRNA-protein transferase